MNELLQKHGCSNVFSVPEGLRELMSDISREVLREQPTNLFEFIANYLSVLLITREHGVLALRLLEDLCDCKPTVSEHLMQLGMEREQADSLALVIKEEIEGFEPIEGKEKVKETQIIKKILTRSVLDEDMASKVCQVARNSYREYWYRKKLLEKSIKVQPEEPWEIAAQHTLELYKKTKPSFSELTRATQKIQAAYRGYYVRKNMLSHLKPKRKKQGPKVDLLGPPVDVAESREVDLGPMIDIKVQEDNVNTLFDEYAGKQLGLNYDPMKTITHVDDVEVLTEIGPRPSAAAGQVHVPKSLGSEMQSTKIVKEMQTAKSYSGGMNVPPTQNNQFGEMEAVYPRQSRVPDIGRQSRVPSQYDQDYIHKISFAERPPEVIPDDDIDPEDENKKEVMETQEAVEVQEEPGIEPAEAVEGEPAQEVPEDIPDDRTDGDGESAPTASAPSSAPGTADITDEEEEDAGGTNAGGDTTGEDEEE